MNARHWARALVIVLLFGRGSSSFAARYLVHFDQDLYVVNGPGETLVARVLIDADAATPSDDPIPTGLFSFGVLSSFNGAKVQVASAGDVDPVASLDFFGFASGAFEQVASDRVGVKGNIDQVASPLQPYGSALLAEITFTNLASAVDEYPLDLELFRTVGPNEQLFLDGTGLVLDPDMMFRGARVRVVPEPSTVGLALLMIAGFGMGSRRRARTFLARLPESGHSNSRTGVLHNGQLRSKPRNN
jgi:hypothetical protein